MITIPLSYERPPLTTNRMPRNFAHRQRIINGIHEAVGWAVRLSSVQSMWPIDYPVVVRLVWTVPDNRVRDSSGPDPTLKAAQDGLVMAGILKDDRHEIVTRSYCVIEKGDKFSMRLEIEAAS